MLVRKLEKHWTSKKHWVRYTLTQYVWFDNLEKAENFFVYENEEAKRITTEAEKKMAELEKLQDLNF